MQLRLDAEGPGSYEDLVEYVEQALRQNTTMREGVMISGTETPERKMARALLTSVLARLGVDPS